MGRKEERRGGSHVERREGRKEKEKGIKNYAGGAVTIGRWKTIKIGKKIEAKKGGERKNRKKEQQRGQ